ncbi:hypothetical protein N665_3716s0001 [Sinapis alba]|nr:hypothetical protein N665_3716s0001 [Sinapis alba]
MGNQIIALTQVFTPLVNSSMGQAGTIPTAIPLAGRRVEQVAEVVEIDPPPRSVRRMDYLKLLEPIAKMGTKHFAGSVDPFEADEWRSGDLVQGRRTVKEYEEEFNRLTRYVGKELEDESVQVRRFIRGLKVELRTYCCVRTFHTVSEFVERMAMLETNLAEEAELKIRSHPAATGGNSDRKRERDQTEESKSSSGRSACLKCGRHHGVECWRAMGACLRCGKMDHSARDCPRQDQGAGGDTRTCHYCGRKGHLRKDCPKLSSGPSKSLGKASRPNQDRGQTSTPRVY